MAEQLVNEFTVNRPIDEAWAVITDVERIAPCLPGAELQEIEGDIYRGVVKVKLGSITPQFKGQATFIDRDDPGHRAVLKAEGPRHRWARECRRRDHRPGREPVPDEHTMHGHDRPPHHRASRPVRSRHPRRRVQEADGPVRQQPQHDARRPAHRHGGRQWRHRARHPATADSATPSAATGAPSHRKHRSAARRCRPVGPAAAGPQDRRSRYRAGRPRRRGRAGRPQAARSRSSSPSPSCWSCCGDGARSTRHPPMPVATTVDADEQRVAELLGRRPAGRYEVVVRDDAGGPVVIRNAPLLDDGTPMPTRYWLVGRAEVAAVSRLEAAGWRSRRRSGCRRRRTGRRPRPLCGRTRRRHPAPTQRIDRPVASAAPDRA